MRFTSADVARFAEWSSDHNPLHVDPAFARGTYFGKAIVHGMFSVIRALEESGGAADARHFDIEFRGAVAPDETYAVTSAADGASRLVSVSGGDGLVLRISATGSSDDDLSRHVGQIADWVSAVPPRLELRAAPVDRGLDGIAAIGQVLGRYRTSSPSLDGQGDGALRNQIFALCSYVVGMEVPGLRSLFTRAELALDGGAPSSDELLYRLTVRRVDPQFRILDAQLEVASSDGRIVAACKLRSYVRFSPVVTDLDAIAAHVSGLGALEGRVALVAGGSRGLGADIAAALALAGARVFVNYRRDAAGATALQDRLAAMDRRIDLLPGDAGEAAWCADALATIGRLAGPLDILVLNACAPPTPLALNTDTVAAVQAYLASNLPLIQAPFAAALPDLRSRSGTVVYVSSSFVTDLPARFGHYAALKQAGEALVTTGTREAGLVRAVILRPPPLQTAWNDTPTGALGTIPADQVAVTLARTLAAAPASTTPEVIADFPALEAVTARTEAPANDAPVLSLAVTASFTADPLEKGVTFWGRELGVRPTLSFAPYSQVLQTLFDPASNLSTNAQGLNVVLLRVQDWLRELPPAQRDDLAFVRTHLESTARDLVEAMRAHRGRARASTLLLLCPSSAAIAETSVAAALNDSEHALRSQLDGVPGLLVLRAADAHDLYDVAAEAIDDPLRDKIGHIPYADAYFHVLATIVVRQAWRRLMAPRKIVVVDCDNTLWAGVVGEVGAEGVAFDAGHLALHETLTTLSAGGVLVGLCSKNEEEDVWRVFETRTEMTLRREHVVAAMINWRRKSDNLRELATRLNLGLDSFVFIDDNHVECAEVRAGCPEVLTLEWPHDPEAARRLLTHTWELDAIGATAEDRQRTQMYLQEAGRQELRQGASTFRDFLESLELVVDVAPLSDADLTRASQLTLRTNQFNFTTVRRDESELRALLETGRHDIRTVRVRDRFGDYGLVGLLVAERQASALVTDTFLMSCRVLGRGAEHRMAAELGRIALGHELDTVHMRVEPTKRNAPAQAFLESLRADGLAGAAATAFSSSPSAVAVLECDLPAATLAELRYEPQDTEPEVPVEGAAELSQTSVHDERVGDRTRARESQIVRTATHLATQDELAVAIDGRSTSTAPATAARDDVADIVRAAFARSLGRPQAEIVAVDQLEALGCDSFRIVEITVGLVEHFPWLPSTLLFEHRSVQAIVAHIEQMADARSRPVVKAAAPALSSRGARRASSSDVAVVGMDLRTAGASSPEELWDLLSRGGVALRPVPATRRSFTRALDDTRPHWAGLLDDLESFDAAFFGISPREADLMDPQLRLFLQVAWGALEDADAVSGGVDPDTGVFAGVMYDDYAHHANRLTRGSGSPYKSWESFSLANRLSHVLGLRGPSLVVDTACSSSGTALHLACRAIADGDCTTAIVGGVNVILDPERFAQLGRLGILSATGRCLSFGKDADGTVLGEGVGVVVLRSLDVALERGDRIYGVIKGTGLSTGSGTVGFTAPNPQAQAVAIRRALAVSGVDPATIGYIETHGTATLLGDPIEIRGLTLGYGVEDGHGPEHARVGSIKPNIGHLEAGAAVLSLIKVLLQLHRRTLLPSVSSPELNPQIPFGSGPFALQRRCEAWEPPASGPRCAAVSSFGVGGANVHVVVEEGPASAPAEDSSLSAPVATLVTLSARSDGALAEQARALAGHLSVATDLSLGDIAHTLNATRRPFEHRTACVVGNRDALQAALERIALGTHDSDTVRGVVSIEAPRPGVAFLFTGQGAQFHGMGRGLYQTQPVFREALDECAEHLDPLLGISLVSLLHDDEPEDDRGRLDQTRYTQPALFAIEYALARLWQSWGVQPAVVIGHSVGEFAAMCIAGGLRVADAARLIEARGRLMQELPTGGVMVSVTAPEERVRAALAGFEDRASIAGINSPEQTVVSGEGEAVAAVVAALTAEGVRTRALTVSHAFHSPLMTPMVEAFRELVRSVTFTRPEVPIVSCVTGAVATDEMLEADYWVRQILDPVRFVDGMATLADMDVAACLEIGPQPVLVGLGRRCLAERGAEMRWLPSIRREVDELSTLLTTAGQLYTAGAVLDWKGIERPFTYRHVSLPHYAFERRAHWVEAVQGGVAQESAKAMRAADVATYEVRWQLQEGGAEPGASAAPGTWMVLADQGDVATALTSALEGRGGRVIAVPPSAAVTSDGLEALLRTHAPVRGIVHLRGLDEPGVATSVEMLARWREHALVSALATVQASARLDAQVPVWCVTRGALSVDGDTPAAGDRSAASVAQGALWGFGRTVALELPETWGGLVDLSVEAGGPEAASRLVDAILAGGTEDQIALRLAGRFVPRLARVAPTRRQGPTLQPDGTYLVTGGMGALGLRVARWLVDRGARHIVLMGRQVRAEAAVEQLRRLGASVSVEIADVADTAAIDGVLARIEAGGHPLRGVVHAAGVDRVVPLEAATNVDLDEALAAKMSGGWLLHERTSHLELDLFIAFSSLASTLGAAGRAPYAAANAFLDALITERRRQGLPGVAINWGPWAGEGMGADAETARQFEAIGNHLLDPADALHVLDGLSTLSPAQVVVADIEWDRFAPAYASRRRRPLIADVSGGAVSQAARASAVQDAGDRTPDEVARQVREEVAQVLGFKRVDELPLDRGFFEMGLDSLSSVELVARLRQRFGVDCQGFVFDTPTVAALSDRIVRAVSTEPSEGASTVDARPADASPAAPPAGVVRYQSSMEEALFAFHEQAFGSRRRSDWVRPRWRWMFEASAARLSRPTQVWLYQDDDRIVGHNAALPVELKVGSETLCTAWLVETNVLAAYQSQALGPRLMAAAHEALPFALSLGQTETMRAIQLRMGWHSVAPLQTAQLLLRPERVLKGKLPAPAALGAGLGLRAWSSIKRLGHATPHALTLEDVDRYGERHDVLWTQMAADVGCAVVRDQSYLNWKYVDQPGQSFIRLDAWDGERLAGTSVWMLRDPDTAYQYRRAFLVDIVAPLSATGADDLDAILQAGCAHMAQLGADAVQCLHIGEALTAALTRVGFSLREPGRFLLVYPGHVAEGERSRLLDGRQWLVTQGDSDIDRPW